MQCLAACRVVLTVQYIKRIPTSAKCIRRGSQRCAPPDTTLPLQFHFENMKLKAQQRIKEGRPQPVDPLAVNLFLMPEFDASISAPHAIFIGLTLAEVEDVCEEIMTWQVSIYTSSCPEC